MLVSVDVVLGNSGCCVGEMLVSLDVVWGMLVSLDEAWRNKCISGCCVGKMLVSVDVVGGKACISRCTVGEMFVSVNVVGVCLYQWMQCGQMNLLLGDVLGK